MNEVKQRLMAHPFFQGMNPQHLHRVAEEATEAIFQPGEILFSEGEPANKFYLITSGQIALETDRTPHERLLIQPLSAGEVLGWSWLFPPFSWHFQARAVEQVTAIVVNGAQLLVAAEENHDFGFELMKRVAQVVIRRLQSARNQLLSTETESVIPS